MGIFDRFPYSSTHEMNLDFMLGKATEIAEALQDVQEGLSDIDTHKAQAEQAAQAAAASQAAASASAASADQHKTDAEDAADRAEAAWNGADAAADRAEEALGNMTDSETVCLNAAARAEAAQDAVAASASAASSSAANASQNASQAAASAGSAANSATAAANSANSANASATNASLHATNAATSATNAATSATNAATSATFVAESKDQVETLIESLPEDFTDLNNKVNDLKSDLTTITPGNTLLSQILCPDFTQTVQNREIKKVGNTFSSQWIATNNKSVFVYFTGTVHKIIVDSTISDTIADINQLIPLSILGHNQKLIYNILSTYEGTTRSSLYIDYYTISDNTPVKVSYEQLSSNFMTRERGVRIVPFSIPYGATHFALYDYTSGSGSSHFISLGIQQEYSQSIISKLIEPSTWIASRAYTANQFLVLNSTLYRVTSPIANGAQIIPGTNVIETTIGEVLTNLLNAQ